ncbi:MAG: aminotransferase class III-fold pyridoxal phosphate-dependent enzyme, partial [Candidatus Thorarchaeota archaeon]|nr:aminotransferase class III-fold pyridoxal phosphate-dependent enzyme [Candidatus Thorarchaeota archaeon]
IEIIQEENYLEKASKLGEYFKKKLEQLQEDHKIIGDVRGQGMMLGVELVRDRATKEPAIQEMLQVMEFCREMGLLIGKGGLDNNVMRLQPPLELTNEQLDESYSILDEALSKVEKNL